MTTKYEQLNGFTKAREKELTEIYSSVIELTDRYGKMICRVTNILRASEILEV